MTTTIYCKWRSVLRTSKLVETLSRLLYLSCQISVLLWHLAFASQPKTLPPVRMSDTLCCLQPNKTIFFSKGHDFPLKFAVCMHKAKQVRVQNKKSLPSHNPYREQCTSLDKQDEQYIMHLNVYSFDSTCFSLSFFFPNCTFFNIRIGIQTVTSSFCRSFSLSSKA